MWQFNEKRETLIAAKPDPNYSLWHSAVSRTELEPCGADASGAGTLQGSTPTLGLKAALCHQAEQGQAPWDPALGLCVFPEPLVSHTAKLRMLFVSCPKR